MFRCLTKDENMQIHSKWKVFWLWIKVLQSAARHDAWETETATVDREESYTQSPLPFTSVVHGPAALFRLNKEEKFWGVLRTARRGGDKWWLSKERLTDWWETEALRKNKMFFLFLNFFFLKIGPLDMKSSFASVRTNVTCKGLLTWRDKWLKFLFARPNMCFNCCRQLFRNFSVRSYWKALCDSTQEPKWLSVW